MATLPFAVACSPLEVLTFTFGQAFASGLFSIVCTDRQGGGVVACEASVGQEPGEVGRGGRAQSLAEHDPIIVHDLDVPIASIGLRDLNRQSRDCVVLYRSIMCGPAEGAWRSVYGF